MAQLRRDKGRLDAAGLQIVLAGMGTADQSERFRRDFRVPFPLVCDPGQELYRLLSIPRGHTTQVLGPSSLLRGVGAVLKGNFIGRPVGDPLQLPGAIGVDTSGAVWYAQTGSSAGDHATAAKILTAWGETREA